MELDFIEEDIPKIARVGGAGREPEKWEDHIAPLKADDRAGKSFRVWTYEKRASAVSRMSSVRDRLTKAVPQENWQLAVRPVPNAEPEQFGVYVSYAGQFTPEQITENARKHQERSERVKAARAATAANATEPTADTAEPTGDTATEPGTPEPTAKERVAQARAKATA
jgi:ribosomal protein S18